MKSGKSGVMPDPCLVESARHVSGHADKQRIEGLNEPIERCLADI